MVAVVLAVRFHQLAAMLASLVNMLKAFASALEYDEPMIRIRHLMGAGDRSFDVQCSGTTLMCVVTSGPEEP